MNPADSLDVALRIGQRLARQALWDGPVCSWEIQSPDLIDGSSSALQSAGGPLYQGTSGIAWFLAELSRVTADDELARVAEGGLGHALAAGADLAPAAFGFHSGRPGIAWVAAHLARTLERPELLDRAWELLAPLSGNEAHDQGLDVIAGAAGAIPALLELADLLDRDEPREMALRLGEHLFRRAHHEPNGWSWPMMANTVCRHLNGLAHGAAGVGLALLELDAAGLDPEDRFRFAAEMAFLYERGSFDPDLSNWPDFRNTALGELALYSSRRAELVERARRGDIPPYQRHFMSAWCHGSPGIGLARLRALELTGHEIYRDETRAAVLSTLASIDVAHQAMDNFSLCHGVAGNCELPLAASEPLGEPSWRRQVEEAAAFGWETYEKAGQAWPCGTLNRLSDPSLLLGEAGIGAFYLRLAHPEVPSPLLLRPATPGDRPTAESAFPKLAEAAADEFFDTSRRVVTRLTGSPLPWTPPTGEGPPLGESPPQAVHSLLEERIGSINGALRAQLEDACRVDRETWRATQELGDFSDEFVHGLVPRPWEDLEPRQARFQRAPDSRLLTVERWWEDWPESSPDLPPEDEHYVLLHRRGNRIHRRRVGVLAALLLDALGNRLTLEPLVVCVAESFDGAVDPNLLTAKILPQLEELYRAGFVVVV